jgi:hypothetical protein
VERSKAPFAAPGKRDSGIAPCITRPVIVSTADGKVWTLLRRTRNDNSELSAQVIISAVFIAGIYSNEVTRALTLDKICEDALGPSDESKAALAERIVEYLETHANPDLERVHLDTVKRRKDEMRNGQVVAIDGQDASVMARRIGDAHESSTRILEEPN